MYSINKTSTTDKVSARPADKKIRIGRTTLNRDGRRWDE